MRLDGFGLRRHVKVVRLFAGPALTLIWPMPAWCNRTTIYNLLAMGKAAHKSSRGGDNREYCTKHDVLGI